MPNHKMRKTISDSLRLAEQENDSERIALLRLINAAIIDKDSVARSQGVADNVSDQVIVDMLNKMKIHRTRSAVQFDQQGHVDLASRERREIELIDILLPRKLTEDEMHQAVSAAIREVGAKGIRDKGRVIGELKSRYRDQMDFGEVGHIVVQRLC